MKDKNEDDVEKPSKSQIKRDMVELQKLGESMLKLSDLQLVRIPMPEQILESIRFAKTLKTHESIRRQLQYIGKLMREYDAEEIRLALKKNEMENEVNTRHFHQLEQWREQLIEQGDEVLKQFVTEYPNTDVQHLRQLIRNAKQDRKNNKNTGSEKKLFKYLREIT